MEDKADGSQGSSKKRKYMMPLLGEHVKVQVTPQQKLITSEEYHALEQQMICYWEQRNHLLELSRTLIYGDRYFSIWNLLCRNPEYIEKITEVADGLRGIMKKLEDMTFDSENDEVFGKASIFVPRNDNSEDKAELLSQISGLIAVLDRHDDDKQPEGLKQQVKRRYNRAITMFAELEEEFANLPVLRSALFDKDVSLNVAREFKDDMNPEEVQKTTLLRRPPSENIISAEIKTSNGFDHSEVTESPYISPVTNDKRILSFKLQSPEATKIYKQGQEHCVDKSSGERRSSTKGQPGESIPRPKPTFDKRGNELVPVDDNSRSCLPPHVRENPVPNVKPSQQSKPPRAATPRASTPPNVSSGMMRPPTQISAPKPSSAPARPSISSSSRSSTAFGRVQQRNTD